MPGPGVGEGRSRHQVEDAAVGHAAADPNPLERVREAFFGLRPGAEDEHQGPGGNADEQGRSEGDPGEPAALGPVSSGEPDDRHRRGGSDQGNRAHDVQEQLEVRPQVASRCSVLTAAAYALCWMDTRDRHLKLLTDTIEAVNSTLDLEEVLAQVATKVADALRADACFVYLYDEHAGELVLRATHGTSVEEMTQRPRMRPGEGITGVAAEDREPVMIAKQAHLDPRFKNFPNLPEDEYESILAVPILARGERLEGALNLRTREPRDYNEGEIDLLLAIAAQVAQSIEHAKLYEEAQRRVHELEALARISEAVSESLYLEESLEAIVKTTVDALSATGAALVLEDGAIAWPEGRADAHAIRSPLRWRGRQIGELVADRASPFTQYDHELLASIAQQAAVALEHGRAVMRGVLAQEIHHRVKNNLQTVASLLRLQARDSNGVDPKKALEDSVNRILAIAAVHEVLTEQRDDDVDLADLLDRLRAMLVQGIGAGREVRAELEAVTLAGQRATALALVFSELLGNALEHGGKHVRVDLHGDGGDVVLAITDDGGGIGDEPPKGTGLSIVRALVRDELRGTLDLSSNGGTRAEVRFPG
jgi:two-component sensor histidine kinase